MSTYAQIAQALSDNDYAGVVRAIPYANYLGIRVDDEADRRCFTLPFRENLVGNTRLRALHGGVLAGFLEISAQLEVLIGQQQSRVPGPVDFAIDYLRSAKAVESYVSCRVLRQGSRVAQVQAQCWQNDPAKPVAFARVNFLLQEAGVEDTDE